MSLLHDRLRNGPCRPDVVAPGQAILTEAGWLDDVAVPSHSYLVDPRPGRPTRLESISRSTATAAVWDEPPSLDALALDDVAASLLAVDTWLEMVIEAPVVAARLDDSAHLNDTDRAIGSDLHHLATVAHEPNTKLLEETELEPVGRVRRPARGSIARLAGHSEDWHRRRFRSVEPRRILSRRLRLDIDTYENRVARSLIEPKLPAYLLVRLRDLDRLGAALEDLLRSLDEGTHWRQGRIYELWRDAFEDQGAIANASRMVTDTRSFLTEQVSRLRHLRGSVLYRELAPSESTSHGLRRTNVLANDQHYRRVASLWRAVVTQTSTSESKEDRVARLDRRHRAMSRYVTSLIARSLYSHGYRADDEAAIEPGGAPLGLAGPWNEVTLTWEGDDTLLLGPPEFQTRIIPLASDLAQYLQSADDSALTGLRRDAARTMIAFLGAVRFPRDDDPNGWWSDLVWERTPRDHQPWLIPVSPIEPTSIERLGRAVTVAALEPAVMDYPIEVLPSGEPVAPRLRQSISALEFLEVVEGRVLVLRPMATQDENKLEALFERLREATYGPGWERDHERLLQPLDEELRRAHQRLERLLSCPVCGAANPLRPAWQDRDRNTFRVKCSGCRTSWGLDACGNCGGRIPILDLAHLGEDRHIRGPGWVERVAGRDALASPCWARPSERRTFVCPHCGHCGTRASVDGESCGRCRP